VTIASVPRLRAAIRRHPPGLSAERELWEAGARVVVGMDEVGRGAWAGPISVGAAVVPADRRVYKIRDSKLLTESEREALFDRIAGWCVAWGVGHASHEECDELGMSAAQRLAAHRALERLGMEPDRVIVDGNWDFVGGGRTDRLVRGDRTSLSIAAASILAKVTRDRIMRGLAPEYPAYNFEANKGYPCPVHKAALQGWGPSAVHRRSWAFMDGLIWTGVTRTVRDDPQLSFDLGG
jgi:ribonuclease HII